MHVPMFPRAMHCLKVESVSPPWGAGQGAGGYVKYSSPSAVLSVSKASISVPLKSALHPAFCHSFSFYLLYIAITYTLLYPWIIVPPGPLTQTPQVFTSLPVLWRACSTVCHFLLWTLQTIANSSYSLPLTESFSVLFCERAHVWNLASRLPSLVPFQTPRDAFCRLLWTISKLHGLKKLNSLPVLHISPVVA